MPQLDKLSYFAELFWLLLVLIVLYVFLLRWALPTLAITLKIRGQLVSNLVSAGIALNQEMWIIQSQQSKLASDLVIPVSDTLRQLESQLYLQQEIDSLNIYLGTELFDFRKLAEFKLISLYLLIALSNLEINDL